MSRTKIVRDAEGKEVGTIKDGPGFVGGLIGLAIYAALCCGWASWACILVIFGVPILAVEILVVAAVKRDVRAGWTAASTHGEWAIERLGAASLRWVQEQSPV